MLPQSSVDQADLLTYLHYHAWVLDDDGASRFIIYSNPRWRNLEIPILRNPSAQEQAFYRANALQILSNLSGQTPTQVAAEINQVNRDVLRVRILNPSAGDAISLRSAAQQVSQLKQLVAFAACSELDRRPFYLTAQRPEARQAVENYRFGHTFKGSFGFTIETPRIIELDTYTQPALLPELVEDRSLMPAWRRIMERITRGLVYTRQAVRLGNPQIIIDHYPTALNANMCQALASFSDKLQQVEYSIQWAAIQLPTDPEISQPGPIILTEPAYNQLNYASNQLSTLAPLEITLTGRVIELAAKDSPLALDTSRTIRIRWISEEEDKAYTATATLTPDDYQLAIKAHGSWSSVQITGLLKQDGRSWRFISYSRFHLQPD